MDSQFQQLAAEAFGTPGVILAGHLLNQGDNFSGKLNRLGFRLGLPSPEQAKAGAIPAQERFGLDDRERFFPISHAADEQEQPKSITAIELGSFDFDGE